MNYDICKYMVEIGLILKYVYVKYIEIIFCKRCEIIKIVMKL